MPSGFCSVLVPSSKYFNCSGNEHTVLLCRTGEVYTAGYNDNGQCGQGTTQRVGVLTRVPIVAGRKAVQVKTQQFTAMSATTSLIPQQVFEVLLTTASFPDTPSKLSLLSEMGICSVFDCLPRLQIYHYVKDIFLSLARFSLCVTPASTRKVHAYNGCEHTLVVLDDGQMVSFGYNYRGQLGHGTTSSEPVPKPVRGLDGIRVTQVSCSYYHSVIACDNGEVTTEAMTQSRHFQYCT